MTALEWEPATTAGPAWEGPGGWPSEEWLHDWEWGDDHPGDLGDDR